MAADNPDIAQRGGQHLDFLPAVEAALGVEFQVFGGKGNLVRKNRWMSGSDHRYGIGYPTAVVMQIIAQPGDDKLFLLIGLLLE